MVTADIATDGAPLADVEEDLVPQREWSLPTLRLYDPEGDGGDQIFHSRSANGHCRHCDSVQRFRPSPKLPNNRPQREWSLPTLRLLVTMYHAVRSHEIRAAARRFGEPEDPFLLSSPRAVLQ